MNISNKSKKLSPQSTLAIQTTVQLNVVQQIGESSSARSTTIKQETADTKNHEMP